MCASPDIAPVTAKVVQERPRPKSPHVGEAPRTNVAGCPIAPTCLAGSGSSPREVGFLKKLTSCVSTRPTGPHPLRARELTTPHPEGLTTRLVPVEVDLKQQIFDVCSSLNNGHSPKGRLRQLCANARSRCAPARCAGGKSREIGIQSRGRQSTPTEQCHTTLSLRWVSAIKGRGARRRSGEMRRYRSACSKARLDRQHQDAASCA